MGEFTLNVQLAVRLIKQYNTSGLIFSLTMEAWSNSEALVMADLDIF